MKAPCLRRSSSITLKLKIYRLKLKIKLSVHLQIRFWSQHISFLLVGVIAVTSVRGLLITLTKFFYMISSSKSSNLIVLILAHIMVSMNSYFPSRKASVTTRQKIIRLKFFPTAPNRNYSFLHRRC